MVKIFPSWTLSLLRKQFQLLPDPVMLLGIEHGHKHVKMRSTSFFVRERAG
jgi:hypothetical protein